MLTLRKRGIRVAAGALEGRGEQVGVGQELDSLGSRQVGERRRGRVLAEQNAVSGEELHVADHGVSASQLGQHRGVLAAGSRADPIVAPVHPFDVTALIFSG